MSNFSFSKHSKAGWCFELHRDHADRIEITTDRDPTDRIEITDITTDRIEITDITTDRIEFSRIGSRSRRIEIPQIGSRSQNHDGSDRYLAFLAAKAST